MHNRVRNLIASNQAPLTFLVDPYKELQDHNSDLIQREATASNIKSTKGLIRLSKQLRREGLI